LKSIEVNADILRFTPFYCDNFMLYLSLPLRESYNALQFIADQPAYFPAFSKMIQLTVGALLSFLSVLHFLFRLILGARILYRDKKTVAISGGMVYNIIYSANSYPGA